MSGRLPATTRGDLSRCAALCPWVCGDAHHASNGLCIQLHHCGCCLRPERGDAFQCCLIRASWSHAMPARTISPPPLQSSVGHPQRPASAAGHAQWLPPGTCVLAVCVMGLVATTLPYSFAVRASRIWVGCRGHTIKSLLPLSRVSHGVLGGYWLGSDRCLIPPLVTSALRGMCAQSPFTSSSGVEQHKGVSALLWCMQLLWCTTKGCEFGSRDPSVWLSCEVVAVSCECSPETACIAAAHHAALRRHSPLCVINTLGSGRGPSNLMFV